MNKVLEEELNKLECLCKEINSRINYNNYVDYVSSIDNKDDKLVVMKDIVKKLEIIIEIDKMNY